MGKGDKKRAQNKLDEQQRLSQGYLTGLQGQLGGQYGNYGNLMFGSNAPQFGANTYGYGTTTPYYNPNGGNYFPGSTTGNNNPTFTADQVRAKLMPYLQSLGGASSDTLEKALPEIQRMFPGTTRDNSQGPLDEIVVPGVGIVDLITNAEGSGPKDWSFQTGPGGGGQGGILGRTMGDYGNIMSQYQNWAKTGGLSEQDKANLRQRAGAPIRSMYERGQQDLSRQRALQGGYSPGYTTALTRMNRNLGQGMSDATGNAEANITQMMQQGKQFGMGGMSSLYGATPGLANTFGNQALEAMRQQLVMGGLQNNLSGMLTGRQVEQGNMQGFPWKDVLGGIGSALPFVGGLFGGGGGSLPNYGPTRYGSGMNTGVNM